MKKLAVLIALIILNGCSDTETMPDEVWEICLRINSININEITTVERSINDAESELRGIVSSYDGRTNQNLIDEMYVAIEENNSSIEEATSALSDALYGLFGQCEQVEIKR